MSSKLRDWETVTLQGDQKRLSKPNVCIYIGGIVFSLVFIGSALEVFSLLDWGGLPENYN